MFHVVDWDKDKVIKSRYSNCNILDCDVEVEIVLQPFTGQIWLDNMDCSAVDEILDDCKFKPWGIHNCNHNDDVGVVCLPSELFFVFFSLNYHNACHVIKQSVSEDSQQLPPVENLTVTHAGPTSISIRWNVRN